MMEDIQLFRNVQLVYWIGGVILSSRQNIKTYTDVMNMRL